MRNFNLIILLSFIFFASCNGQNGISNSNPTFIDTTKPFIKQIPISENGKPDLFYTLAKAKQKQLGLDSIESGFDNLQIRIWYDFSLVRERKLITIINKNSTWTATVYNLKVDWDGQSETIISKEIKQVSPKSGWSSFIKQLLDLKILTLPDMYSIKGLADSWDDGTTYNVEIATKSQYRFYGYHMPDKFQGKFWQARNMTNILEVIKDELSF